MSYQTHTHERNYGCRLREFSHREYRCVTLVNESLRVLVAEDKGTDILEFLHKPTDTDFMWHPPHGLRPPSHFRASSSLAEAARKGTGLSLDPGETLEIELEATAFTAPLQVCAVESGGDVR